MQWNSFDACAANPTETSATMVAALCESLSGGVIWLMSILSTGLALHCGMDNLNKLWLEFNGSLGPSSFRSGTGDLFPNRTFFWNGKAWSHNSYVVAPLLVLTVPGMKSKTSRHRSAPSQDWLTKGKFTWLVKDISRVCTHCSNVFKAWSFACKSILAVESCSLYGARASPTANWISASCLCDSSNNSCYLWDALFSTVKSAAQASCIQLACSEYLSLSAL